MIRTAGIIVLILGLLGLATWWKTIRFDKDVPGLPPGFRCSTYAYGGTVCQQRGPLVGPAQTAVPKADSN